MSLFAQVSDEALAVPEIPWLLISPLLVMTVGAVLLLTLVSAVPAAGRRGYPAAITALIAIASTWLLRPIWDELSDLETARTTIIADSLLIDPLALWVWGIICISVFFSACFLDGYLRREGFDGPEWYSLVMISAVGGMLLTVANDLILMFLAIEILSIGAYVLVGLHLRRADSQEAAFKYFILGALASALLLYGIALMYGATGSTKLSAVMAARSDNAMGINPTEESSMILVAMAMLLIGFGFKVSAVPFHMWTPDVYQGAPTPITGFMASAVKAAGFAGLLRLTWEGLVFYAADWQPVVAMMAILSMVVGSVLALAQTNVKRMLAYSSIVHAGFILLGVWSMPTHSVYFGLRAVLFYLLAYALMSLGSFGVLTVVGGKDDARHSLDDYRGLAARQPVLSAILGVLLFAQAGVPFTVGFWAKVRVIAGLIDAGGYVMAAIAVLAGVVSAVLYLRIVVAVYMSDPEPDLEPNTELERAPRPALMALALTVFGVLSLGLFPDWGSEFLDQAVDSLEAVHILAGG